MGSPLVFPQILLITEDETVPQNFCVGNDLPITCYQYAASEARMVAEYLQSRTLSALFSPGDHQGCCPKFISHPHFRTGAPEKACTWLREVY